jgi:5-deoxy-D-glucuronate isomerase
MSVFKTTFSRALNVIPSEDANIPYPTVIVSGTVTDVDTDKLVDDTVDFIALNVKEGDIVYNITNTLAATVVSVDSNIQLTLNADIFTNIGEEYIVYQASPQTGLGNPGCFLYIKKETDYKVVTIGGDVILFDAVPNGTILPVQVIKLISGDKCIALW